MIIDIHTHVEFKNSKERYSPEEFVAAMDKGDIDISIVLGGDQLDAGNAPAWAKDLIKLPTNFSDEEVANFCRRYPDRLIGFASIHPGRYRPELKVERALKELGLRGLKLYPHSGFYPNDARLNLVYQKCAEMNIPVMIHTGIKAVSWQKMKYNNPIFIDDVATNFPELKIIMCHGGYPWVEEFIAVAYSNPNIWVDLTFLEYIERTFKRPGLAEDIIKRLYDLIGPKKLLWGSEGPFMNLPLFGKHGPENYKKSQDFLVNRFSFLSEEDKKDILGKNAEKLLNIGGKDERRLYSKT